MSIPCYVKGIQDVAFGFLFVAICNKDSWERWQRQAAQTLAGSSRLRGEGTQLFVNAQQRGMQFQAPEFGTRAP